ncbi:MAG: hypothetical protein ACK5DG_14520 [Chitinophagaceae bacterium]
MQFFNQLHLSNGGEWSLKFPILPAPLIIKMSVQEDFRKKNKPVNIKAIFDVVMGLVYAGVGITLVLSKYIGLEITFPPAELVTIFGTFAILYGIFRIYRGIKTYNQNL